MHRRKYHENVRYSCSDCDFEAKTQIQINIHKKTHHEGIRYICNTCDLAVVSLQSLENHKKNKHEGIRYHCPKCDYKATMRGNLKIHIQAMHEGLEYHCNQCSYKASTPRSLKLHEKSKHVIWTMYKTTWIINLRFRVKNLLHTLRFTYFLTSQNVFRAFYCLTFKKADRSLSPSWLVDVTSFSSADIFLLSPSILVLLPDQIFRSFPFCLIFAWSQNSLWTVT